MKRKRKLMLFLKDTLNHKNNSFYVKHWKFTNDGLNKF